MKNILFLIPLFLFACSSPKKYSYISVSLDRIDTFWACDQEQKYKVGDTVDLEQSVIKLPARILVAVDSCEQLDAAMKAIEKPTAIGVQNTGQIRARWHRDVLGTDDTLSAHSDTFDIGYDDISKGPATKFGGIKWDGDTAADYYKILAAHAASFQNSKKHPK